MDTIDRLPEGLRARLPDLMRAAIAEARRADQPFGCTLADLETGELWVAAPNASAADPTDHAEVNGLRILARRKLDARRAALISTAEPCPMCASASWWAGVGAVVFGTPIATLIAAGWSQLDLPMAEVLARATPPRRPIVVGGYLSAETDPLYRGGPR